MIAVFSPSVAKGSIQAPPSKSMAHRMILCAGLARQTSTIRNLDPSEDILATTDCLRAMGADIVYENRTATIRGVDPRGVAPAEDLPCRACGSTLRFFIPVCLLSGHRFTLTGSHRLLRRPLSVYRDICAAQGLCFSQGEEEVTVQGRLTPGEYRIPGDISSQFISGLLFALPFLEGDSTIRLLPPVESRSYIHMTMQALEASGIRTEWTDPLTITVPGRQTYKGLEADVEGDYSNAAFFDALNLAGGSVDVHGLQENSLQGDRVYREYFRKIKEGRAQIDLSDCPDLGPILMALAALHNGAVFTGTRRLSIKESSRGEVMRAELEKMGARADLMENEIYVYPGIRRPTEPLDGNNDHRIVMALSTLLTKTGGVIRGAEAVRKSLPDYFERLRALGISVQTMDA